MGSPTPRRLALVSFRRPEGFRVRLELLRAAQSLQVARADEGVTVHVSTLAHAFVRCVSACLTCVCCPGDKVGVDLCSDLTKDRRLSISGVASAKIERLGENSLA